MVSLLIAVIIAVIIMAVLFYAIDWAGLSGPPASIIKLVIILAAILIIIRKTGVL